MLNQNTIGTGIYGDLVYKLKKKEEEKKKKKKRCR